jgi:hypothetical protein
MLGLNENTLNDTRTLRVCYAMHTMLAPQISPYGARGDLPTMPPTVQRVSRHHPSQWRRSHARAPRQLGLRRLCAPPSMDERLVAAHVRDRIYADLPASSNPLHTVHTTNNAMTTKYFVMSTQDRLLDAAQRQDQSVVKDRAPKLLSQSDPELVLTLMLPIRSGAGTDPHACPRSGQRGGYSTGSTPQRLRNTPKR